ncbi:MAG TPA: hypothetical protein VNA25_00670 [Phycisphaerae bacterium]|nr:hypothetical protein [Phycisphaerae bacterium]
MKTMITVGLGVALLAGCGAASGGAGGRDEVDISAIQRRCPYLPMQGILDAVTIAEASRDSGVSKAAQIASAQLDCQAGCHGTAGPCFTYGGESVGCSGTDPDCIVMCDGCLLAIVDAVWP